MKKRGKAKDGVKGDRPGMRGVDKTFGNIAGHYPGMANVTVLSKWIAEQFDPTLSWKDVEWIKSLWPGKLILKGILDVEDARIAAKTGAAAIVVSNHGGRQLDGAVASIRALPAIVEAVGGKAPVLVDGGFRRGVDVVKALALGARAVLIGRPHLWGVACAGEDGVFRVLELFRREIDRALALGGWDGIAKLDRSIFFDIKPAEERSLGAPRASIR